MLTTQKVKLNLPYTKKFSALTLFFVSLIFTSQFIVKFQLYINPYIWYLLAYVVVIMYISHLIIAYGFSKSAFDAQNFFMLGTSLKLLLSAVVIFLYFYRVKSNSISFLLNFFVLYFVYTFFEIKTLLLSLHPHSNGVDNR
jgi:hypothetical protein